MRTDQFPDIYRGRLHNEGGAVPRQTGEKEIEEPKSEWERRSRKRPEGCPNNRRTTLVTSGGGFSDIHPSLQEDFG